MTKEQKANGYADEDMRTVLSELDEMDEEAEQVMASARGKVSAIRKRQKNRIKIADKELKIPPALVRAVRKQRKLERQLQDVADDMPEDLVELYLDASNQFSFLAPEADEPETVTPAERAARKRAAQIAETTASELAEADAVLEEMAGAVH